MKFSSNPYITLQTNKLVDSVKQAIDEKAWDSGHITGDRLVNMLEEFKGDIKNIVNDRFKDLRQTIREQKMLGTDDNNSGSGAVVQR